MKSSASSPSVPRAWAPTGSLRGSQQHHPPANRGSGVYRLDMGPVDHKQPSASMRPPSASYDPSQALPHRRAPSKPSSGPNQFQHYLVWPRGECANGAFGSEGLDSSRRSPSASALASAQRSTPPRSPHAPRSPHPPSTPHTPSSPPRGRVADENTAKGTLATALQPQLVYDGQPVDTKAAQEMGELSRENERLTGEQSRIEGREKQVSAKAAENELIREQLA
eukprot:7380663-Prymnesium_polylepis.1